jgi:hypoxanthine-DNA glycosylase
MERPIESTKQPDIGMPPVVGDRPRVLILGSMPGERSLRAQQYYAHPTNAFWPIMGDLLEMPSDASYPARLRAMKANRMALWDVVYSCRRRGSLDSNIQKSTVVPNDLEGLLSTHPTLKAIVFNGKKAQELFLRHIAKQRHLDATEPALVALPSTSAAHASLSRETKREQWRVILEYLGS